MKKGLILICLTVLIFTITSGVMAAGSIGVDVIPGGSDSLGSGDFDLLSFGDMHQTGKFASSFLSFEGVANDFKVAVDLGSGTDKFNRGDFFLTGREYDFTMAEYKFGARVINRERVKWDITISSLQIDLEDGLNHVSEDAYLLGFDAEFAPSKKVSFGGSLGWSAFGVNYEENGVEYDPNYLMVFKARVNFAVADHAALSIGYRNISCLVDGYDTGSSNSLNRTFSGFSVGVRYTF